MKGRIVLIVLFAIILGAYFTQYYWKVDLLKFWPRLILGIAGLFFMIIMHIYSIRKRKKNFFLFKLFSYKLPTFLNIHIILATMGVALIVVHAIGSYNSIIAWISFFSMFMVWQSGFVGKYIFVRIPKDNSGLHLEKTNLMEKLEQINSDFIAVMKENHENKEFQGFLIEYLTGYAKTIQLLHKKNDYGIARFFQNFKQTYNAWRVYKNSLSQLKRNQLSSNFIQESNREEYTSHLQQYEEKMNEILLLYFQIEFIDILKALFKNWHDIHVPLTYLLYTTALLHVIVIVMFSTFAH